MATPETLNHLVPLLQGLESLGGRVYYPFLYHLGIPSMSPA